MPKLVIFLTDNNELLETAAWGQTLLETPAHTTNT